MKEGLRIGNLIESNLTYTHKKTHARFLYVVDEIKIFNVLVHDIRQPLKTTHLRFEDILPIPLTEEWLLKLGFEKASDETNNSVAAENGFTIEPNKFEILIVDLVDGAFWFGSKFGIDDLCCAENPITYVHQLQNLYFALTGQELEIKVPA